MALEVEDLSEVPDGLRVRIRRSKTDQSGEGHEIAIPRGYRLRPVEAMQTWLAVAEISSGPLFRPVLKGGRLQPAPLSAFSAAQIVKRYAMRAGLDPAACSGHSLRAGFLTSAAEAGASVLKMMEVSRHKSVDVLRGYVRRADLFKEHAGRHSYDAQRAHPATRHAAQHHGQRQLYCRHCRAGRSTGRVFRCTPSRSASPSGRARGRPARSRPACGMGYPMTDIQFFAFVELPVGVVIFADLLTAVALALIALTDRSHPKAGE